MCGTGLFCGAACPDGGKNGRDGRADIVAQHNGDGRFQRKKTLYAESDGQADCGGTGLYQQSEEHAGRQPQQGIVAEHEEYVLPVPQKAHGSFHGLHTDEQQTEAEQAVSHMGQAAFLVEKTEQNAEKYEKIGKILDFYGKKPSFRALF